MADSDDTARPDAPAAPRKKRSWKRLPASVTYPPRRARLLVLPGEVEMLTIREAADWLATVATEEADPEQRQNLRGKYRFIYGHALCELIRSGDFHLVKPRTVSRETFEHFARWYGFNLTYDPNESLPQESGVIVPEGRTQAFGLGEPGTRTLYLPAGTTVVELYAVPELLARAVKDDAPPAMRDETALLEIDLQRRLLDELRSVRVVALAWNSREPMLGSCAWSVLARSAVVTREQFERFAALCGVTVSTLPDGPAQDVMKRSGEALPVSECGRLVCPSGKERKNLLRQKIDEAIAEAASEATDSVFLVMREWALNEKPPFNGVAKNGGLMYTDANGQAKTFTRDALAARLKRRKASVGDASRR